MSKANDFQIEIGKFLSNRFPVNHRIADSNTNRYGSFQVSQKPFDFFGIYKSGKLFAAEVKRIKAQAFPIRNLKEHQRKALIDVSDNGGLAWVFINWRERKDNRAIWIPFDEYCEIEYLIMGEQGRKSLRSEFFDDKWFLKRITGGWEVTNEHPLYRI